jgi:perosamine synthetase
MKNIPWWQPVIGKKEKILVEKVFKSNFLNEGKLTGELEDKIAKLLGVKHVLMVPNGTSAMVLSLKALGVGYGDEVIVPDITFIATAHAVEQTGAKAVLVDVRADSLTMDPKSFEKAITKKTKAVIPVHVSGRPADLDKILKIAKRYKIPLIEDSAEAFLSKYKGKNLGTIGITGCFSLSHAKTITTGQGGFVVTNDQKIYERLRELKDQGRPKRGTGGDDIHYSLGFNFKFTDVQAAIGLGQLSYIDKRIKRMRRNYLLYKKFLKNVKEVKIFDFDIKNGELPQWTDAIVEKRDDLSNFLRKNNIDTRNFWHPIHTQNYFKQDDKYFPVSSALSKKAMWLSSAFTLTDKDIKKVSDTIKKFYKYE